MIPHKVIVNNPDFAETVRRVVQEMRIVVDSMMEK